jgi:hypothetical protein
MSGPKATPDELDIVDGIVVHRDRPGGGFD